MLASLALRPGMTRSELCEVLGSPREVLERPMTNLVQSGRVDRTGHKGASRYWATELGAGVGETIDNEESTRTGEVVPPSRVQQVDRRKPALRAGETGVHGAAAGVVIERAGSR